MKVVLDRDAFVKLGRNVAIVSGGGKTADQIAYRCRRIAPSHDTSEERAETLPKPSVEGTIGIGFVSSEVVLSSGSAQCQSDMTEDWPKRKRRRQVYDDASYRNQHSST
jgi:hypothetical protein